MSENKTLRSIVGIEMPLKDAARSHRSCFHHLLEDRKIILIAEKRCLCAEIGNIGIKSSVLSK